MGGGAQRPFGVFVSQKKTGARSARARTRGQNPLVLSYIYLGSSVCHPVVLSSCHIPVILSVVVAALSYSLCFL
jgi:hypothetical protein